MFLKELQKILIYRKNMRHKIQGNIMSLIVIRHVSHAFHFFHNVGQDENYAMH